jgi:hypothetical protein
LPNSPQAGSEMLNMVASFASNQVEKWWKTNRKQAKKKNKRNRT